MTASDPPVWEQISWCLKEPTFDDEPVLSCFLSKVFYYWYGRNAYHYSWVESPAEFASYALKIETLKKRIEEKRVQGSHFKIIELPAMVLMGTKHDLLLVDASSTPFGTVPLVSVAGKSLNVLAKSIELHTLSLGPMFLASFGYTRRPSFPFKIHDSRPIGAGLSLDWSHTRRVVDFCHAHLLIAHVCTNLQAEG